MTLLALPAPAIGRAAATQPRPRSLRRPAPRVPARSGSRRSLAWARHPARDPGPPPSRVAALHAAELGTDGCRWIDHRVAAPPARRDCPPRWNRDDLKILCRRCRQILERVHRDIDLTSTQGVADRADKDSGAANLGELTLVKITGRRNADEGGSTPSAASAVATWPARCARASEDLRAPSLIDWVNGTAVMMASARSGSDLW